MLLAAIGATPEQCWSLLPTSFDLPTLPRSAAATMITTICLNESTPLYARTRVEFTHLQLPTHSRLGAGIKIHWKCLWMLETTSQVSRGSERAGEESEHTTRREDRSNPQLWFLSRVKTIMIVCRCGQATGRCLSLFTPPL